MVDSRSSKITKMGSCFFVKNPFWAEHTQIRYPKASIKKTTYRLSFLPFTFCFLNITRHHGRVETCYKDRMLPLSLLDRPIPTRTLKSSVKPWLLHALFDQQQQNGFVVPELWPKNLLGCLFSVDCRLR